MKYILISFLALITLSPVSNAQTKKQDTVAIMILDKMSAVIGELTSVHITLSVRNDEVDPDLGLISHFELSEVYFDGPDRMLVNTKGDKGHRGFWYNGEYLVFYSFSENNYAVIKSPPTTIETIDSLHECYDFDFPAADFFYPTFTDDVMGQFDQITFMGKRVIEGKECFYISAKNVETTVQLWIANDVMNLPVKMLINQNTGGQGSQYEVTFKEWQINPDLPPSIFEFNPPPGAHEVFILSKCDNQ